MADWAKFVSKAEVKANVVPISTKARVASAKSTRMTKDELRFTVKQSLELQHLGVTDEGVRALEQALPQVRHYLDVERGGKPDAAAARATAARLDRISSAVRPQEDHGGTPSVR